MLVVSEQGPRGRGSESEVTLMEGFAREIGRALDHSLAFELQHEMVERLGVLDRSKNEFLSEVSRELRGPLASVLGYIELLTDESAESVTDEQRRMLGIVERNGEKLLVLISNLLTMSRMEAGEFEPKLGPVDLAAVLERVARRVAPAVDEGALELDVDARARRSRSGRATKSRSSARCDNLVANAVKFTPGGGRIDVYGADADGAEVVIDVRDTGIGIAVERAGRTVHAVLQLPTSRPAPRNPRYRPRALHREADRRRPRRSRECTCLRRVAAARSRSGFRSNANGGLDRIRWRGTVAATDGIEGADMSLIFIVDDDPDVRELVEYKLVQNGHEVLSATNGQDALRLVPDANARSAAARRHDARACRVSTCSSQLRAAEATKTLPIIMLTAKAQQNDAERGFTLGANDYVFKPFSPRELMSRVNAQLVHVG